MVHGVSTIFKTSLCPLKNEEMLLNYTCIPGQAMGCIETSYEQVQEYKQNIVDIAQKMGCSVNINQTKLYKRKQLQISDSMEFRRISAVTNQHC